jgi:hypothetical protein
VFRYKEHVLFLLSLFYCKKCNNDRVMTKDCEGGRGREENKIMTTPPPSQPTNKTLGEVGGYVL